jgi:glycine/D-amino acid oxidase-like deaminating enzyme
MGYGKDEIYTRWAQRSLAQWKELFTATRNEALFQQTGVCWFAAEKDSTLRASREVLTRCGVNYKELDRDALASRFSQIDLDGIGEGIFEPESGVLMARRAVAAVVAEAVRVGVEYRTVRVEAPNEIIRGNSGELVHAGEYVFACGSWLAKLFPRILGQRIFVTRQAVFYMGVPAGDERFSPPTLPTWLIQNEEWYGMPNLESRGLKIALDRHGEAVDPDTLLRVVTQEEVNEVREYVARRFPALRGAPIAETRVCQYENTSNGDFLIDRHPETENVWFAGGGSGHGFKHGPALGEYVTSRILGEASAEPRFALASKETVQHRAVY